VKKPRNYGKNLGKYLHKAKLPDKSKKIGLTKLKFSNQKNRLGSTTVVKPSRKRIRKMIAQKEF